MANPYQLYVNRPVSYKDATRGDLKWTAARIVSITDQNNVVLEYSSDGGSINGGLAVPRSTRTAGETNVWRPY